MRFADQLAPSATKNSDLQFPNPWLLVSEQFHADRDFKMPTGFGCSFATFSLLLANLQ